MDPSLEVYKIHVIMRKSEVETPLEYIHNMPRLLNRYFMKKSRSKSHDKRA